MEAEAKAIEYDISALAKQFALPPAAAHDLLWNEIHQLEQAARIRDFVPLLALKHVKEHLREMPLYDLVYGLA
ncbi:MAG: DUF3562 domain-containing protein [Nitrospira sp.]